MLHALLLLLPLALAQPAQPPAGLTFAPCTISADCAATLSCVASTLPPDCPRPDCRYCIPTLQGLQACFTLDDCGGSEACFAHPDLPAPVCMSASDGPRTGAHPVGDSSNSRLTLDTCVIDQDCAGDRTCRFLTPSVTGPCDNQTTCKCLTADPVSCVASDVCDQGEVCALTQGLGTICVSAAVATEAGVPSAEEAENAPPGPDTPSLPPPSQATSPPSTTVPIRPPPDPNSSPQPATNSTSEGPSNTSEGSSATSEASSDTPPPTSGPGSSQGGKGDQSSPDRSPESSGEGGLFEGVCMDARLLSHLSRSELVFSTHRLARVLCDAFGSCATAGHMVMHSARPMMMRRYCENVGCAERIMEVNSPRRRRGTAVPSRTEGLVLTAFAARYGTSLEESVLRIVIKVAV